MIDFKRYFPPITDIEVIARRFSIRDLERLRRDYGGRDWRKLKGRALVELKDGSTKYANCIGMSVTASANEKSKLNAC